MPKTKVKNVFRRISDEEADALDTYDDVPEAEPPEISHDETGQAQGIEVGAAEHIDTKPGAYNVRYEYADVFKPLLYPARYKGAFGGRASGKSHFFAEYLVFKCLAKHGSRFVGIREIQKSIAQSSRLLIADKIKSLNVGAVFEVMDSFIRTPGDGIITFYGMQNHTAESIKSLEGYDGAWVDEAHRLSRFSLDLLRPTIRADSSELMFSWNPKEKSDPVDSLLRKTPPASSVVVEANYDDNPWLPREVIKEIEYDRRRDPEKYKHVWLGEYQARSEARVFHNWKIEEFDTPPDAVFYHGADWGFAKDPTVLVRCFVNGRTLYVDHEAWKVGCEIDHTPALFDSLDPEHPQVARKWRIVADSSNPQSISYMRRNGYPNIHHAVKGAHSVEEGVEFLKSYDIIVHPRCVHVADELAMYSYEVDKLTEEVLPKLADMKNHTIDSLRYAVEGIRRRPNPPMWGSY